MNKYHDYITNVKVKFIVIPSLVMMLFLFSNVSTSYALSYDEIVKSGTNFAGKILNKIDEKSKPILSKLESTIIPPFIAEIDKAGILNKKDFFKINKFYDQHPEAFSVLVQEYPKTASLYVEALSSHTNKELNKVHPMLQGAELDEYSSRVVKTLQNYGYARMTVAYAEPSEIDKIRIYQDQGLVDESIIGAAKIAPTVDLETGKVIMLDEAARKYVDQNPYLKESDFGKDPVRVGLLIFLDSEYLYIAPLIPISDSKLISIDEYCKLQVDFEKCEQMKILLHLIDIGLDTKNPKLVIPATIALFKIAQEFDQNNPHIEQGLAYSEFLMKLDPTFLANEKLIRSQNGKHTSLNDATSLGYNKNKISITKSLLSYSDPNDETKIEQMKKDTITLFLILEDINKSKNIN